MSVSSSLVSKILRIQEHILRAVSVMLLMCGPQDRSEDISTPRSLMISFGVIIVPSGVVYS